MNTAAPLALVCRGGKKRCLEPAFFTRSLHGLVDQFFVEAASLCSLEVIKYQARQAFITAKLDKNVQQSLDTLLRKGEVFWEATLRSKHRSL